MKTMKVYHVTTLRKLNKYLKSRQINPPVRAWVDIKEAERMSVSTGRRIILRLRFPDNTPKLAGHKGKAYVLDSPYKFTKEGY